MITAPTNPAALFLCLLAVSGCATSGWEGRRTIVEERHVVAELETFASESSTKSLAHPQQIEPERIESCLRQIEIRSFRILKTEENLPAVGPDRIATLARAISSGLATATPSERVRFWVRNREPGRLLDRQNLTKGVAFFEPPAQLNVVFDTVCEAIDDDEPDEQLEWDDPTSYSPSFMNRPLILSGDAKLRVDAKGKEQPWWVAFDLK